MKHSTVQLNTQKPSKQNGHDITKVTEEMEYQWKQNKVEQFDKQCQELINYKNKTYIQKENNNTKNTRRKAIKNVRERKWTIKTNSFRSNILKNAYAQLKT